MLTRPEQSQGQGHLIMQRITIKSNEILFQGHSAEAKASLLQGQGHKIWP